MMHALYLQYRNAETFNREGEEEIWINFLFHKIVEKEVKKKKTILCFCFFFYLVSP